MLTSINSFVHDCTIFLNVIYLNASIIFLFQVLNTQFNVTKGLVLLDFSIIKLL